MTAPSRSSALVPPLGSDAVWAAGWTPAEARLGVDQWKRGTFRWAWQLGIDSLSHPAIKCAEADRSAEAESLPWDVGGPDRAPGRIEKEAAAQLFDLHLRRLIRSTLFDLGMFGMSVWHHPLTIDPETLRTEIAPLTIGPGDGAWAQPIGGVQRWPLSAVGWTAYPLLGVLGYYAIGLGGERIQLPRPGETSEEWTVVGRGDMPHVVDAAIVALDMPFTGGMLTMRARNNLGISAGRASPIGYLPDDEAVNGAIGKEAQLTLAGMGEEQAAALFPAGMKVDKFELTTVGAAEYFHTDLLDLLMLVSMVLRGHAGALAKLDAQYQPKAGQEENLPQALVRRDVTSIERAASGIFAMLALRNAGLPAERAPKLCGHLPDADQAARIEAEQKRQITEAEKLAKFHNAVSVERANGFQFIGPEGQKRLEAIAKRCGVEAPILPPQGLPPALVKLPPSTTTLEPENEIPKPKDAPGAAPTPSTPEKAPAVAPASSPAAG